MSSHFSSHTAISGSVSVGSFENVTLNMDKDGLYANLDTGNALDEAFTRMKARLRGECEHVNCKCSLWDRFTHRLVSIDYAKYYGVKETSKHVLSNQVE